MSAQSKKRTAERRLAKRWLVRVMRFLKTDTLYNIRLHKLDKNSPLRELEKEKRCLLGYCHRGWNLILIDPRYDVLSASAHECIHLIEWNLTEKEVRRIERLVMEHISDDESIDLHRELLTRFMRGAQPA